MPRSSLDQWIIQEVEATWPTQDRTRECRNLYPRGLIGRALPARGISTETEDTGFLWLTFLLCVTIFCLWGAFGVLLFFCCSWAAESTAVLYFVHQHVTRFHLDHFTKNGHWPRSTRPSFLTRLPRIIVLFLLESVTTLSACPGPGKIPTWSRRMLQTRGSSPTEAQQFAGRRKGPRQHPSTNDDGDTFTPPQLLHPSPPLPGLV